MQKYVHYIYQNANKDKSVLLNGINVAVPIEGAKALLDEDFATLSY